MLKKLIKYLKIYVIVTLFYPNSFAFAANYYMACYYYDTNRDENTKNPNLMRPSMTIPGATENYFWAIDKQSEHAVILDGEIIDGFFYAYHKNYETAQEECNAAIAKGTFFWRSKKSYKLYDIKASNSNYSAYEYPIRFVDDDNKKGIIKQIVLFGDSLSDTGNLKRWTKIMPAYPFWFGRFSDGFIWNDYLKKNAHLPILNFAFGGAKTEGNNNFYIKDYLDYIFSEARNLVTGSSKDYIQNYLNNYLTTNSYKTKSFNITNSDETLYLIWIGANDYISTFEQTLYSEDFFLYPNSINGSKTVSKRAVNNIIEQISALKARGAKHFLVLNLPDFGKTPLTLKMKFDPKLDDMEDKYLFSKNISDVINFYNSLLASSLDNLKRIYNDDTQIDLLDISSRFNALLNGKNIYSNEDFNYGFSILNSKYPIPGESNKYIQDYCYKGSYLDASKNSFVTNSEAYSKMLTKSCKNNENKIDRFAIFWNSPHPTSYAHCWISYLVLQELKNLNYVPNSKFANLEQVKDYCQNQVNH